MVRNTTVAQTHCFDRSIAVLRSGRVRTDGSDRTCLKSAILPDCGR
jgi:hypothetical protein